MELHHQYFRRSRRPKETTINRVRKEPFMHAENRTV